MTQHHSSSSEGLVYEIWTQQALYGVVRRALRYAALTLTLPSDHAFYITFATNASDVKVPDFLRQTYPEEVTVVLQHQFWNLSVNEEGFSVTLLFDNQPHDLYIPFHSLIGFMDPEVKFGLQFDPKLLNITASSQFAAPSSPSLNANDAVRKMDNVISLDQFRKNKND